MNPDYKFRIWRDSDIIPLLDEWEEIWKQSSIFHKLQLARYTISEKFGGLICDFDLEWRQRFCEFLPRYENFKLVLPKRKSLYFFNHGEKTTMLDDYVIFGVPGAVSGFLNFCLSRKDRKSEETEPFSVFALTEFMIGRRDLAFFLPEEIYHDGDPSIAFHHNQKTWRF